MSAATPYDLNLIQGLMGAFQKKQQQSPYDPSQPQSGSDQPMPSFMDNDMSGGDTGQQGQGSMADTHPSTPSPPEVVAGSYHAPASGGSSHQNIGYAEDPNGPYDPSMPGNGTQSRPDVNNTEDMVSGQSQPPQADPLAAYGRPSQQPQAPQFQNIPQPNLASKIGGGLTGMTHRGSILGVLGSMIGGIGGNDEQRQSAAQSNAMQEQNFQNNAELYKAQLNSKLGAAGINAQSRLTAALMKPPQQGAPLEQMVSRLQQDPANAGMSYEDLYKKATGLIQGEKPTPAGSWETQVMGMMNSGDPQKIAQAKQIVAMFKPEKPAPTETPEMQKSYQYNRSELDKYTVPVSDQARRAANLTQTLDQGTAQGDALVPAEVMISLAGGLGSGLRINNAEIQNVRGGRPAVEGLQASLAHWLGTDQKSGISLPQDQRAALYDLMNVYNSRLQQKSGILDQAGNDLISAKSPQQHRQITQKAISDLRNVDVSNMKSSVNRPGAAPSGQPQPAGQPSGPISKLDFIQRFTTARGKAPSPGQLASAQSQGLWK